MSRTFSVTDSVFAGFRLMAREPKAAAVWVGAGALAWIALFAVGFAVGMPLMIGWMEASWRQQAFDWRRLAALAPSIVMLQLAGMVLYAAVLGFSLNAIARAVLRPEDRRGFYLRFGAAELRTGAAYVILMLLASAVMLVLAGLVGVLWLLTRDIGLTFGVSFLAMFAAWIAFIWGGLRLSLLLPMVGDTGRIDLRAAWRLSRGVFWQLLGLAVFVYLFSILVSMVIQPVLGLFVMPSMMATAAAPAHDIGPREAFSVMAPTFGLMMVLMAPLMMVQMIVTYAPFVDAYRALSATSRPGGGNPPVAEA